MSRDLEPELQVVFDTLKGYGVSDPDAFIGLLHHWKAVKAELVKVLRSAANSERCPFCSDWHRDGPPLVPFRVERERSPDDGYYSYRQSTVVHSPRCAIGNLLMDIDPFFKEDTIHACMHEARLMHDEWKKSPVSDDIRRLDEARKAALAP